MGRYSGRKTLLPLLFVGGGGLEPPNPKERIYSPPQLPLCDPPKVLLTKSVSQIRADGRIRTVDPEITNHVLWPAELHRQYFKPFLEKDCKDRDYLRFSKKFSIFFADAYDSCTYPSSLMFQMGMRTAALSTATPAMMMNRLFQKSCPNVSERTPIPRPVNKTLT